MKRTRVTLLALLVVLAGITPAIMADRQEKSTIATTTASVCNIGYPRPLLGDLDLNGRAHQSNDVQILSKIVHNNYTVDLCLLERANVNKDANLTMDEIKASWKNQTITSDEVSKAVDTVTYLGTNGKLDLLPLRAADLGIPIGIIDNYDLIVLRDEWLYYN